MQVSHGGHDKSMKNNFLFPRENSDVWAENQQPQSKT